MNIFAKRKRLREIEKEKSLNYRIREVDVLKNLIFLYDNMVTSAKFEYTKEGKKKFEVAEAVLHAVITGSMAELSLCFRPEDFVNQERDLEKINKEEIRER